MDHIEKLDILKNEYLPIIIDRIVRENIEQEKFKEHFDLFMKSGILIKNHPEPVDIKRFLEPKTFEEYLKKRKKIRSLFIPTIMPREGMFILKTKTN